MPQPHSSPVVEPTRVGTTSAGLAVFASSDRNNAKHLFVPVEDSEFEPDQRSTGVILLPQLLALDGDERWYADLVCHEPKLFDVFGHLADDVTMRVATEKDSLESIRAALKEWRELLRRVQGAPTESSVIGLRGELDVLNSLVEIAGPEAVHLWRGPLGAARDFQGDSVALEVKTTLAQSGYHVTIHGLEQVTPPENMAFAIALIRLTPNNQAPSVNSLIRDVSAEGVPAEDIEAICAKAGWSPGQVEWDKGYETIETSVWRVDDSFPGLRRTRIDPVSLKGLDALRYQLDLSAGSNSLTEGELSTLYRELCGKG